MKGLIAAVVVSTSTFVISMFTATEWVTVIAALGVMLAGMGVTVVNVIVALRRVETKVGATADKIDEVKAETKVIGGHVNSNSATQLGKIDALEKELTLLRSVMANKESIAALLAQSEATRTLSASLPHAALPDVAPATESTLVKVVDTVAKDSGA